VRFNKAVDDDISRFKLYVTGHESSDTIHRYRQAARSAAELRLGWLRTLDRSVFELRKGIEKARSLTIAR
jgi:hypothetical protein